MTTDTSALLDEIDAYIDEYSGVQHFSLPELQLMMNAVAKARDKVERLLPCPFCGGEATDNYVSITTKWLGCQRCGVSFSSIQKSKSLARWNTRAGSSVPEGSSIDGLFVKISDTVFAIDRGNYLEVRRADKDGNWSTHIIT